ncbi:MAG TPA: hypothetical protein VGQ64_08085 [Candidatus Limnocylindrales bacterium]|jgi:hypothetical protein|nr:hypothetical protein [Candidatus Limnocylindrales bacterium]
MDADARAIEALPSATREILLERLEPGERITHAVPAVGCVIALTTRRLILLREGSSFRPKSGIRDWSFGRGLTVRMGLVRRGTGSLAIVWERDLTSVFVKAEHWDEALELAGAVRSRVRLDQVRSTR